MVAYIHFKEQKSKLPQGQMNSLLRILAVGSSLAKISTGIGHRLIAVSVLGVPAWTEDIHMAGNSRKLSREKPLLQQEEIDINARDGYGDTALLLALKKRELHVVELLLQREEIDMNAKRWVR